ncbi:MAG: hypothetical protein DWQ34_05135 [Planctomycetota bacterium]|nr:MAG: hypothetical protein DWQ29_11605 [Planctomycetota bacterium]REJ95957.1 MAG: hypothetical protein DWQ34_05135 [Planctomycetota bacterium]REK29226.1 MAG: hypothetical protein DWQ41_04550 [Planctomycetota bacterium]REK29410.1 MAG: hypothetical protein DWQ45_22840 [Planctomycetota bacterium]
MKIFTMLLAAGLVSATASAADVDSNEFEIVETAVQPVNFSEPVQLPPATDYSPSTETIYQPMDCNRAVGCGRCSHSHYSGMVYCRRCEKPSCCERCRNRSAWRSAHTTGDLYPHFPYRPQYGGYYYFRPYNYMNVYTHQSQIVNMGGDPRNPYSVSMFGPIYEEFGATAPLLDVPPGSVRELGSGLPKLEDLLLQP